MFDTASYAINEVRLQDRHIDNFEDIRVEASHIVPYPFFETDVCAMLSCELGIRHMNLCI
ncbi:MAG: hypothetical protein ACXABG_13930 [Promethearchaeota archaeon]